MIGDMNFPEGIVKRGVGALTLGCRQRYPGGMTICAGTLCMAEPATPSRDGDATSTAAETIVLEDIEPHAPLSTDKAKQGPELSSELNDESRSNVKKP